MSAVYNAHLHGYTYTRLDGPLLNIRRSLCTMRNMNGDPITPLASGLDPCNPIRSANSQLSNINAIIIIKVYVRNSNTCQKPWLGYLFEKRTTRSSHTTYALGTQKRQLVSRTNFQFNHLVTKRSPYELSVVPSLANDFLFSSDKNSSNAVYATTTE